jgi:hypothetical protein
LSNALDFWSPFVLGETRDRDLGKVAIPGEIGFEDALRRLASSVTENVTGHYVSGGICGRGRSGYGRIRAWIRFDPAAFWWTRLTKPLLDPAGTIGAT